MAHQHRRHAGAFAAKQAAFVQLGLQRAVFTALTAANLPAAQMAHQLHAIADAQHGHAHLQQRGVARRRAQRINAVRSAGENDAHGGHRTQLLGCGAIGNNLRINAAFAHAACNQFLVLPAKIDDDNGLLCHETPPVRLCRKNKKQRSQARSRETPLRR